MNTLQSHLDLISWKTLRGNEENIFIPFLNDIRLYILIKDNNKRFTFLNYFYIIFFGRSYLFGRSFLLGRSHTTLAPKFCYHIKSVS